MALNAARAGASALSRAVSGIGSGFARANAATTKAATKLAPQITTSRVLGAGALGLGAYAILDNDGTPKKATDTSNDVGDAFSSLFDTLVGLLPVLIPCCILLCSAGSGLLAFALVTRT